MSEEVFYGKIYRVDEPSRYYSFKFTSQEVFDQAVKLLDRAKQELVSLYNFKWTWERWRLVPQELEDVTEAMREIMVKYSPICKSAKDVIIRIEKIHASLDEHFSRILRNKNETGTMTPGNVGKFQRNPINSSDGRRHCLITAHRIRSSICIVRIDAIGLPNTESNTFTYRDHYALREDGKKYILTIEEDGVARLYNRSTKNSEPIVQVELTVREQLTCTVDYAHLKLLLNNLLEKLQYDKFFCEMATTRTR